MQTDYIGIYFLTIISYLYIFDILLGFRLNNKVKEIIVLCTLMLVIASQLIIKGIDYNLHKILVCGMAFVASTVIYKEITEANKNIFRHHKDVVYFIITFILIMAYYFINTNVLKASDEVLTFFIFIYHVTTLSLFLIGFFYQQQYYAFKIGARVNVILIIYILTFMLKTNNKSKL